MAKGERSGALLQKEGHQARRDPLTGLPDRSVLFAHLQELLDQQHATDRVAVLFVDLDRFKTVNDSLGHDVGDRVLVEVARRIRRSVRPTDLVARLAGDEFVVVCTGLQGSVDALGLADRLVRDIALPIAAGSSDVIVTASVGVATRSDAPTGADMLLRDADLAMYRAKQRGGDRVEAFGRNLRAEVRARLDLERGLRSAIVGGELSLAYQPIVCVDNGLPVAVEALIRWTHDGRSIPPDEFIPIAEETGLIVAIGRWVLGEACRQVAAWRQTPALAALKVSVNVSGRQFRESDFVEIVRAELTAASLPAGALWLEVTESVLLDDVDDAVDTLRALRSLGVRISIDDFGTGYSSLAYLREFPVDAIKIDRSFVSRLDEDGAIGRRDAAVLAAVVALGRALDVGVIVEGVERPGQLAIVRDLEPAAVQGFHFARPMASDAAVEWLTDRLPAQTLDPVPVLG